MSLVCVDFVDELVKLSVKRISVAHARNGTESYENLENCGVMTAQQIIDALEGREPVNRRV